MAGETNRWSGLIVAALLLASCTSTKASPATTTRAPLVPTETVAEATTVSASTSTEPIAFGEGCPPAPIPFQPVDPPAGWDTSTAVWGGVDPVNHGTGIIEIHHGAGLPTPTDPTPITILGSQGAVGRISDGFIATFTLGTPGDPCHRWALVAHPLTSLDTLRSVAQHLTTFGVGTQTIDCRAAFNADGTRNAGDEMISGVIDLPIHRALQTSRSTLDDGTSVLFAKNGLVFRAGTAFDLVVPTEWRGKVAFWWGDRAAPKSVVHVPACAPRGQATTFAFPGGFFALHPVCAQIDIVTPGSTTGVFLGIGTPCPGQSPVEGPTET